MKLFNIVGRKQSGALTRSTLQQIHSEQAIAYHLGQLEHDSTEGKLLEDMVENMDETYFVFNVDNHKTLGFIGLQKVRYSDVSRGEGMTMVLRLSG